MRTCIIRRFLWILFSAAYIFNPPLSPSCSIEPKIFTRLHVVHLVFSGEVLCIHRVPFHVHFVKITLSCPEVTRSYAYPDKRTYAKSWKEKNDTNEWLLIASVHVRPYRQSHSNQWNPWHVLFHTNFGISHARLVAVAAIILAKHRWDHRRQRVHVKILFNDVCVCCAPHRKAPFSVAIKRINNFTAVCPMLERLDYIGHRQRALACRCEKLNWLVHKYSARSLSCLYTIRCPFQPFSLTSFDFVLHFIQFVFSFFFFFAEHFSSR